MSLVRMCVSVYVFGRAACSRVMHVEMPCAGSSEHGRSELWCDVR